MTYIQWCRDHVRDAFWKEHHELVKKKNQIGIITTHSDSVQHLQLCHSRLHKKQAHIRNRRHVLLKHCHIQKRNRAHLSPGLVQLLASSVAYAASAPVPEPRPIAPVDGSIGKLYPHVLPHNREAGARPHPISATLMHTCMFCLHQDLDCGPRPELPACLLTQRHCYGDLRAASQSRACTLTRNAKGLGQIGEGAPVSARKSC